MRRGSGAPPLGRVSERASRLLAKLCCALDEPLAAYEHVRALCAHAPREPASWALFHCVAARARLKRPDERWTLRLLLKHQDSPPITLAVAHRCLMARSFDMAVGEYHALHARRPSEPLLPLCLAACKLQESLSRKSKSATRGHAALVAASWLSVYAQTRSATHPQEVAYNFGRAYHHLGLTHLAVPYYIQALLAPPAPASADAGAAGPTEEGGQDVSREAAYNLVRIFRASGNHDLARELTRAFLAM